MGTKGLIVRRFKTLYYPKFNRFDSDPWGLGSKIVACVPSDPEDYQTWLKDRRKVTAEWEAKWKDYLTVDPEVKTEWEAEWNDDLIKKIATEDDYDPTPFAPVNYADCEWVYIIDLDREIFSFNNEAHFKLDQVRHVDWIGALKRGVREDLVPLLPTENVPNLVAESAVASGNADEASHMIGSRIVTPKNIADIPWRRRHGPVFRSHLFQLWATGLKDEFAATLLQWSRKDAPFREIAFAILCLASGEKNVAIVPSQRLELHTAFAKLDTEIVSYLAAGAHLSGDPAGSSPTEMIYSLDGVLVFLTTQLYRSNAVNLEVFRVAQYCHDNHSDDCVDAVLISIEHVVLVHINPRKEIQHSGIMPLIPIEHHLSMDARSRYSSSYLNRLASRNDDTADEKNDDDEDPALQLTTKGIEGDPSSTFYALTHMFDAAARRRIPKFTDGRFPNEIYARILTYVTDSETKYKCMEVSRLFRAYCQENLLIADGLIFESSTNFQQIVKAGDLPELFDSDDDRNDQRCQTYLKEEHRPISLWKVLIGVNRRSLLHDLNLRMHSANPSSGDEVESRSLKRGNEPSENASDSSGSSSPAKKRLRSH